MMLEVKKGGQGKVKVHFLQKKILNIFGASCAENNHLSGGPRKFRRRPGGVYIQHWTPKEAPRSPLPF